MWAVCRLHYQRHSIEDENEANCRIVEAFESRNGWLSCADDVQNVQQNISFIGYQLWEESVS